MLSKAEFRGGLVTLAGLLALVLLITSLSPGLPGELLLQSLRFHIVAAGFVLVVMLWLFGARWRGTFLLLLVLAALAHGVLMVVELHRHRQPVTSPPIAELRVMSYNVLSTNPRTNEAVQHMIEVAPDLVLVMESPGVAPYLDQLAQAFPYHVGCEVRDRCDISLHSRLPLANARIIELVSNWHERLVTAEVEVDGQAVTVVGIHMSKPYFDQSSWMESYQLRRLLAEIEGPVILAGDFNAAPWSDPMMYVARQQNLVPPPYHPATWPVKAGALGVPIDNMFTRGSAQIIEIAAGADTYGSNHRYLLARVGLYAGL